MNSVGDESQATSSSQLSSNAVQRSRIALFASAGFSLLTAVVFWLDPQSDFFHPVGAAFYATAGIITLCLVFLIGRNPSIRRASIGVQLFSLPIQFATSTESHLPLVGALLSVVAIVLLQPRFPYLSPSLRRLMITLHVGFSASWLGAASAMLVLSGIALLSDDPALRHNAYVFMHLFDLVLWIPLTLLTLVSGLGLSLGTEWGLVRYRWVAAKLALVLGLLGAHFLLIQLTDVLEPFWVRELAEATAADPGIGLGIIPLQTVLTMVAFVATLWIATALSIYKPWGTMRWRSAAVGRLRKAPTDESRSVCSISA